MTYTCRWHPIASEKGKHTKDECVSWHAKDLSRMLDPKDNYAELVTPETKTLEVNKRIEALTELFQQ